MLMLGNQGESLKKLKQEKGEMVEKPGQQIKTNSQKDEQIENMSKTIEKLQAQLASVLIQEEFKKEEQRGTL